MNCTDSSRAREAGGAKDGLRTYLAPMRGQAGAKRRAGETSSNTRLNTVEDEMNMCVVPQPKRPQLSDAIDKLDQMVDGLATAIPGAVAESVREVLGTALVAAIKDAVQEAVRIAVGEAVRGDCRAVRDGPNPGDDGSSGGRQGRAETGRLGTREVGDRPTASVGPPGGQLRSSRSWHSGGQS